MLRNGGERHVERLGELARRFLAVLEQNENRSPPRMGDRMEDIRTMGGTHSVFPCGIVDPQILEPHVPVRNGPLVELCLQAVQERMQAW